MIKYIHGMLENLITPNPIETKDRIWDNNIFCFDIEVSSSWYTPNNKMINFIKEYDANFYKECVPFSLCYIWQFSINDVVLYGRELEDFYILLQELSKIVDGAQIWVHNLSYEFQFLLNDLDFDKVFARKPHKVIYADWRNIRFRCSYFLTRLSLENWGIQHGKVQKLVGNIDYNVLRTPLTELDEKQFAYCENDVLVMYYGLLEYRNKYTYVHNIPLTQTGEVRRVIKNMFKYDMKYHKKMTELLPRDIREYELEKRAFQGGYTHANRTKAGKIIDNVKSTDISSSYPTVMCSEKFPMGKWFFVRPYDISKYKNEDYSLIIDVTLFDVEAKGDITYISTSKLIGSHGMIKDRKGTRHEIIDDTIVYADNGRVISTKKCRIICTNIDLDIIYDFYNIKDKKYNYILASKNDYLDERLISFTLDMYNKKTTLKNVEGKEDLYMQSKQFLNSIFGMMVTDLIPENIEFNGTFWTIEQMDIESRLDELRSKPYKNFLAYQHGLFISAYARRNLMWLVKRIDKDVIYCDTDSVKFIGDYDKYISEYNKMIDKKLLKCLDHYNLSHDLICPYAPNGEQQHLGHFEYEKTYKAFITQGSKRYAYTYGDIYEDDEPEYNIRKGDIIYHCTVSGVNKKVGGKAIKNLADFKEDFVFESDFCKRLIFTYLSDNPPILWNEGKEDEYLSTEQYGINSMPSTYSMKLGDEFRQLLLDYIMSSF